jgi:uncharacterized protein (TIGR00369 family)
MGDGTAETGVLPIAVSTAASGLDFLVCLRDGKHPLPPFAAETDIRITEVEHGRVLFEGLPSARFYNPLGTVHGGWIATLLDSAMGCAVHATLAAGEAYATVDMTVSLVRAVTARTGKLRCEGKIVHVGARIATAEGRVWDGTGTLIAHGTETCLILNARR